MANKRISELAQATNLTVDDLLLITDVINHESKKLTLGDLNTYFATTGNSGSFYGTASWANTSSFALVALNAGTTLVTGGLYPITASWTQNIDTASYADRALTASNADISSYSLIAEYALTAATTTTAYADLAKTASYLNYNGIPTGTASYAFTSSFTSGTASYVNSSSYATTSSLAMTASYVNGNISNADYATIANYATSANSCNSSLTTTYLSYTGLPNGTASYALVAKNVIRTVYGMYLPHTQSITQAQIDNIIINSGSTEITVDGTITSSMDNDGVINLIAKHRLNGTESTLDSIPISVHVGPSPTSGSLKMPYSLRGQMILSGSYIIYATASNNLMLDSNRINRFSFNSDDSNVTITPDETINTLNLTPSTVLLTFSSSTAPTPAMYQDYLAGFITTGSNNILALDVSALSLTSLRYVYTLPNLNILSCSFNLGLKYLGGLPTNINSIYCNDCGLTGIASLSNTSASILDCSNNQLTQFPDLPSTMSYIDCSGNNITSLPNKILPSGSVYFNCSDNPLGNFNLSQLPFPSTLISMSVANTSITIPPSWPANIQYLDFSDTALISVGTIPTGALYIYMSNVPGVSPANVTAMVNGLFVSNPNSGSLNLLGNGPITNTAELAAISTLTSTKAWTVLHD